MSDDIVLEWLDPADADDRHLLIEAAHPQMRAALEAGKDEIEVGGQAVNIGLHMALHDQRVPEGKEYVAALAALPGGWPLPRRSGQPVKPDASRERARVRKAQRAARRRNRR